MESPPLKDSMHHNIPLTIIDEILLTDNNMILHFINNFEIKKYL